MITFEKKIRVFAIALAGLLFVSGLTAGAEARTITRSVPSSLVAEGNSAGTLKGQTKRVKPKVVNKLRVRHVRRPAPRGKKGNKGDKG